MGATSIHVQAVKPGSEIHNFREKERYLLAVGITAGIALKDVEEQIYGDVVVADEIWDYATGKFVSPEKSEIRYGNVGFLPRPAVIRMDPEIRKIVERAAESEENQSPSQLKRTNQKTKERKPITFSTDCRMKCR